MRSLGPGVIQVQHQGRSNGLLEIEIPDLHVTQRIIHIDRVVVGDGVDGGGPENRFAASDDFVDDSTLVCVNENGGWKARSCAMLA